MFFFANKRSGSQQARKLTLVDYDSCEIILTNKMVARVQVVDIIEEEKLLNGFKAIKRI